MNSCKTRYNNIVNTYINDIIINKDKIDIIIKFINKITIQNFKSLKEIQIDKNKLMLNNDILLEFQEEFKSNFNINIKKITDVTIIKIINKLLSSIHFKLEKKENIYIIVYNIIDSY